MGTLTKLNDVLCANISKVDDILKANLSKWDDNTFCPSATPTPTPTPSPAVNCKNGSIPDLTTYSFYDCCGILVEGTASGIELICYNANQPNSGVVDDGGSCSVTCVTPTPTITPTNTPTPTPTPSVCGPGCCFVELCAGLDCRGACECNTLVPVYLHQPCENDPCELAYADGIYLDDTCARPAAPGYYSDGTDCYSWFSNVLTYDGPC